MYIQVRTMDGSRKVTLTVSRLSTVTDVKDKIKLALGMEPSQQKLYYRGKHLEDGYKLFDYNVKLNDVIQVLETATATVDAKPATEVKSRVSANADVADAAATDGPVRLSRCYKVDDHIDCRDLVYGAWFEAKIVDISSSEEGDMVTVQYLQNGVRDTVSSAHVRPRAETYLRLCDLAAGQTVMVNHNLEDPAATGYWYDLTIRSVGKKSITGTLVVGRDSVLVENVQIDVSGDEDVMRVESLRPVCDAAAASAAVDAAAPHPADGAATEGAATEGAAEEEAPCERCRGKASRRCRQCGCSVCGGKNDPDMQLMCDECDQAYHLACLDPPLDAVPDVDDWYCPTCKNDENEIVKVGDKLKESKRKAKMPSSQSKSKRDWGQGMATVGRNKECTLVPPNHFGAIPGVDVGTCWKFRMQASESGVHRPPVGGIHGRETEGAYSIVLSGGYEDDVDNGDSFTYTGSGGRDLSGNKRTAEQSCDQTLTAFNRALAINCDARLDSKAGAAAADWQKGKPIRVVRNYKLQKHSKYAPKEGNRYDGLYKVARYYPEKGKSGFVVWRFELRRDDPAPAPWTKEGKKRVAELGLDMIYPDGYLEAQASKEAEKPIKGKAAKGKAAKEGKEEDKPPADSAPPPAKRQKLSAYSLGRDLKALIESDTSNGKLWAVCSEVLGEGRPQFVAKVTETFSCICCQELVYEPITTSCMHNICKACLGNSFAAEVYTCPICRHDLGQNYVMTINATLSAILLELFPGYQVGR